jgi:hypothetical protein
MKEARNFLSAMWRELRGEAGAEKLVSFADTGRLGAVFPVTDFATASMGAAGLSASDYIGLHGPTPLVHADTRLASLWFGKSLYPIGWQLPPLWDAIAGDYETADGWIRLHTNAPHHRAAALRVLGVSADKTAVAAAVRVWPAERLETAVVDAGGCAAAMLAQSDWRVHAQGRAVGTEPLVHFQQTDGEAGGGAEYFAERPLHGVRVLDLTRVLAGPVATRFLAGLGVDVLRLDPPHWNEEAIVPEMTVGKRCARLDLRTPPGKELFVQLLAGANVLVHGYRPGALDALGFSRAACDQARAGRCQPECIRMDGSVARPPRL